MKKLTTNSILSNNAKNLYFQFLKNKNLLFFYCSMKVNIEHF